MVKIKFDDMFNRFDRIPACGRRTDRQTDILSRHSPRYAYASRGKKVCLVRQRKTAVWAVASSFFVGRFAARL